MRVIYYWITRKEHIFMLLAYPKNRQDDLTAEQERLLVRFLDDEVARPIAFELFTQSLEVCTREPRVAFCARKRRV